MIADYFTKSLEGKLFKHMRDIIMGLAPFPVEECVEVRNIESTRKVSKTGMNKAMYAEVVCGRITVTKEEECTG